MTIGADDLDLPGVVAEVRTLFEHYETALLANNIEALNNTAWLYGESNDPRALPLAEKAAQLAPQNAAVLDTYGWLLSRAKQKQAALTALRRAAELAPQSQDIQAHLKEAEQLTN